MSSVADQLARLAELLAEGLITREEFDSQKAELLAASSSGVVSVPPGAASAVDATATGTLDLPPETIGAYRILGVVGEGGMGVVYRGRHRSEGFAQRQGGDVAVKVMHRQYAANPSFQARFEREASLGLKLDHRGLVKVFDLVVDRGVLALVMEFVDGEPLSRIVGEQRGPIPTTEALVTFRQIARAVGYAHDLGVIHRDLKPENVMIRADGSPSILDFGIAKDMESKTTRTGTGMGTIDYMAPEQYTDAKNVGSSADIYALGMTLYEMLAGCLPWGKQELSEFAVMTAKASGDFPPPTDHYPDIPPAVVEVLLKTLSVRPEDRPESAEELVRQLDAAVGYVAPLAAGPGEDAAEAQGRGPSGTVFEESPEPPAPPRSATVVEASAAGGAAPRKATEVVSAELAAARSQELAAASPASPDPASLTLRAAAPSQDPEPDEKKEVGAGVFIGVGLLGLLLCGLGLAAISFVLFSGAPEERAQEAWIPPVSTEHPAAVHEPVSRGKAPVTPDPRPAAAPPPAAVPPPPAPAPRVEAPGPTSALDGYYGAINRRDRSGAWRHFAKPGWDYAKWESSLWRTSGCARVNSSRVVSQAGGTAQLWADLCVEDTAAGQVHRWQGPMEVVRTSGGRWAVAGWSVSRAGTCSSSCRP